MEKKEAREFLLERIRQQMTSQGRQLSGLEEQYWNAMRSGSTTTVLELMSGKGNVEKVAIADREFSDALTLAIQQDVASDAAAVRRYQRMARALEGEMAIGGIAFEGTVRGLPQQKPRASWPVWVFLILFAAAFVGVWMWAKH